tara:strand:- start:208 stop:486 length:279 start_codon:yes stop_codon:yes gene_type:complete
LIITTDGNDTEKRVTETLMSQKIVPATEKIGKGTKIRMIKDYVVWGDNTNGQIGVVHGTYEIYGVTRYITKFPNGEFGELTIDMFEVEDESE